MARRGIHVNDRRLRFRAGCRLGRRRSPVHDDKKQRDRKGRPTQPLFSPASTEVPSRNEIKPHRFLQLVEDIHSLMRQGRLFED